MPGLDLAGWLRGLVRRGVVVGLLSLLAIGCATTQHAGEAGLPQDEGIASYYAGEYAGKATANGEIFNPEVLTAAHRSLPFGTRVRVTRIDVPDSPSVVVRINDRGPFKNGRIIDLSKAAAEQLRMIREGIVEVRLEVVSYPERVEVTTSETGGGTWRE